MRQQSFPIVIAAAVVFAFAASHVASAVDHVVFSQDGTKHYVSGQTLVNSIDGGRLIQSNDGTLWAVQPEEIEETTSDATPFTPLDQKKIAESVLAELPDGFRVHETARYVICYDTSRAYASWCGGLLERLHRAFVNYWTRRGMELVEPEFPLVAIVFSDAAGFQEFAKQELGDAAGSVLGYYSLRTNRVVMYDLTGSETARGASEDRRSAADINRLLARPNTEPLVATIVHEATHQIAYNCGLQTRYADNPAWLSEGLANYFETPDLSSGRGWRGIGQVNHRRLAYFRSGLGRRPDDSLERLLADDARFKRTQTGPAAYAEAWALNYYLIHQRPKEFAAYLEMLSKKPRLIWDRPEQRIKDFQEVFGDDLAAFDADFVEFIRRLER